MANLSCGLVGLPNVGKSTLFKAITRKAAEIANYPFCTIDPNIGIVEVSDPRLVELARISYSKKIIPATICFVDIAGLVQGASQGEGLGNQFLSHIRETDAIIQVVRCFEDSDILHVAGRVDPIADIEVIQLELILADLQMATNILAKAEKQAKGTRGSAPLVEVLHKVIIHLNAGKSLLSLPLTQEEETLIAYPFLSRKKIVYVANIGEDSLSTMDNPLVQRVRAHAAKEGNVVIPICAKMEEEISQLAPEDARTFLDALGWPASGLEQLIQCAFAQLSLITYITTGEIETKAWTIEEGTTAQVAAGKIHTDLQRGFIRAEVVSYDDMIRYHGRTGAREAGKARSEGKEYVVKDGDVILFFHN